MKTLKKKKNYLLLKIKMKKETIFRKLTFLFLIRTLSYLVQLLI